MRLLVFAFTIVFVWTGPWSVIAGRAISKLARASKTFQVHEHSSSGLHVHHQFPFWLVKVLC